MLLSCASATKLCASARTSSCSSCTILVLWGSLYFSLAISSDTYRIVSRMYADRQTNPTLVLWSRLGCTELSVLRICLRTPLYSSSACA
jgi:hypothetical protein